MDRLPEKDDSVHMFISGHLKFESSLQGDVYITDMLNRKKYKLGIDVYGNLIFSLIEQE